MVALVKVLVVVALIFGVTAGTVSASQESLPGSVLYPVKLQFEDARLAMTQDGEAKTLLAMTYAQERVDEAVILVERGDEIPEPLVARYQVQVGLALQTMQGLGEDQQLQLRSHFSGTVQNQLRVMEQLMARRHQGENPEPTQARIQTMLQTMQQTQQQLGGLGHHEGGNETPGNAEAPGPNPNDNGNNGEDNGGNGECAGDCGSSNGETKDHDKNHQNGEDNGGGTSDKGQSDNAGGRAGNGTDNGGNGTPNGSGADNGGDGAPNDGGNGNGGSDNGGNGNSDGGNGGSGNGNGGGSGGGGGNL